MARPNPRSVPESFKAGLADAEAGRTVPMETAMSQPPLQAAAAPPAPPAASGPPQPLAPGVAPPGMLVERGGKVQDSNKEYLPPGVIGEATLRKPQIRPLSQQQVPQPPTPFIGEETLRHADRFGEAQADATVESFVKKYITEDELKPRAVAPSDRKEGTGSPIQLPAQAIVNGEAVVITEQVSWTPEQGSTWRTQDGDTFAGGQVQFMQG